MIFGIKIGRRLPLLFGPLLLLFFLAGHLVDTIGINISNIQTMKSKSIQPGTRLTAGGRCRQAHVAGRNLMLQGQFNEALPLLEEGALCSGNPWAWYDLGQSQYALGDLEGAAASWQHSEAGYNKAVRLAVTAAEEGDVQAAQAAWQFAADVDPNEQGPYIQLARLAAASDPEGVEPLLQQAIEANPNAPEAYIELGRYKQGSGDTAAAQQLFEQAHVLAPTDISLLVALAENAAVLGDIPAAIEYWQEVALRNERRRPMAYYRIGELALNDNNFSSALAFFKRAAEIEPENVQVLLGLARSYFALGCRSEATEAYQDVLAVAENEASSQEAQSRLADLAVMTTETIPCPDGS